MLVVILLWGGAVLYRFPSKLISMMIAITAVLLLAYTSGAFDDIIKQYSIRFGVSTDASSLTTGRTELWGEYLTFMANHPLELFWGQGYTNVFREVHGGSHNTILQAIYQFGFVGITMMVAWVSAFKTNKCRWNMPLLKFAWIVSCFSMWLGLDMLFFDDFFVTITLFALGCNWASSPSSNEGGENNEKQYHRTRIHFGQKRIHGRS